LRKETIKEVLQGVHSYQHTLQCIVTFADYCFE